MDAVQQLRGIMPMINPALLQADDVLALIDLIERSMQNSGGGGGRL